MNSYCIRVHAGLSPGVVVKIVALHAKSPSSRPVGHMTFLTSYRKVVRNVMWCKTLPVFSSLKTFEQADCILLHRVLLFKNTLTHSLGGLNQ